MIDCPYVRESVPEDIEFLAPRLLDADVREIEDVSGNTPLASLTIGFNTSRPCFTLIHPKTGEPFAMLGVVAEEDMKYTGLIWMHCTNDLTPFSFLKYARAVLYDIIGKQYGYRIVCNYVDARNRMHVKWLKWMGATIHLWTPIGEKNIPAHPFIIELHQEVHNV